MREGGSSPAQDGDPQSFGRTLKFAIPWRPKNNSVLPRVRDARHVWREQQWREVTSVPVVWKVCTSKAHGSSALWLIPQRQADTLFQRKRPDDLCLGMTPLRNTQRQVNYNDKASLGNLFFSFSDREINTQLEETCVLSSVSEVWSQRLCVKTSESHPPGQVSVVGARQPVGVVCVGSMHCQHLTCFSRHSFAERDGLGDGALSHTHPSNRYSPEGRELESFSK